MAETGGQTTGIGKVGWCRSNTKLDNSSTWIVRNYNWIRINVSWKVFFNFSLKRLEWNIFRSLVTRQSMWKWQVFKQTVDNSECRCGKQLIWRNSSCLLQLRRDLLLTLCSATLPRAILYAQPSVWPATLSCLLLLGQPSLPPGQHHNTTHSTVPLTIALLPEWRRGQCRS